MWLAGVAGGEISKRPSFFLSWIRSTSWLELCVFSTVSALSKQLAVNRLFCLPLSRCKAKAFCESSLLELRQQRNEAQAAERSVGKVAALHVLGHYAVSERQVV